MAIARRCSRRCQSKSGPLDVLIRATRSDVAFDRRDAQAALWYRYPRDPVQGLDGGPCGGDGRPDRLYVHAGGKCHGSGEGGKAAPARNRDRRAPAGLPRRTDDGGARAPGLRRARLARDRGARATADPAVMEKLAAVSMDAAVDPGAEQFGALIRAELERWAKFARESGIRAD